MKQLLKLSFLTAAMVLACAASFAQAPPRTMIGGAFDLKAALLAPAPLGPASHFEPGSALEPVAGPAATVASEAKPTAAVSQANAPRKIASSKPRQKSAVAARKPRSSPLDSYATDARRQTWPCSGGGICAWSKR
jgi:hypothetical protein